MTYKRVKRYFRKAYLINYEIKFWNYYDKIEHITNNASESFNNYLNNLFAKKPTFFKLLFTLKKEEAMSCDVYDRRIGGIWQKRKKIFGRTDEIDILIDYYKESEYLENERPRNDMDEIFDKIK